MDQSPPPLIAGRPDRLSVPQVEVYTRAASTDPAPRPPWYRARRLRVFLVVLLGVLLPGLGWDFLRPPQYRAAASVLTVATPMPDGTQPGSPPETGVQHVAIQERVLLGQDLLARTLVQADLAPGQGPATPEALREMLQVTSLPDTSLVELAAVGGEPERLAILVNAWIDAYQALRREAVEREVGAARTALREEQARLTRTIEEKRAVLDAFRAEHDIVTLERDGNEALARLRALNEGLNRARDEAVEAEARLAAIEDAIARGDPVVPANEQGNLEALEEKAIELRAKLTELGKRFTPFYLENEPDTRVIPAQLAQIEAKIEDKLQQGRRLVLSQAQGEVAQTRQRVAVLEGELARHKETAATFSARFAEHEALKEDLTGLETMVREVGARLVELEAKALERFPAVEVIEPAHAPAAPFHPRYWRDALLILLGAVAAGLAAVLLGEFLTRHPERETRGETAVTGIRVYPAAGALAAGGVDAGALQQWPEAPAIAAAPTASLPPALPRQLIPAEVGALWALADPLSRQLIALLLAGLRLKECTALGAEHFDLAAGRVQPPAEPTRQVPLPPQAGQLFATSTPLPLWAGSGPRRSSRHACACSLMTPASPARMRSPPRRSATATSPSWSARGASDRAGAGRRRHGRRRARALRPLGPLGTGKTAGRGRAQLSAAELRRVGTSSRRSAVANARRLGNPRLPLDGGAPAPYGRHGALVCCAPSSAVLWTPPPCAAWSTPAPSTPSPTAIAT